MDSPNSELFVNACGRWLASVLLFTFFLGIAISALLLLDEHAHSGQAFGAEQGRQAIEEGMRAEGLGYFLFFVILLIPGFAIGTAVFQLLFGLARNWKETVIYSLSSAITSLACMPFFGSFIDYASRWVSFSTPFQFGLPCIAFGLLISFFAAALCLTAHRLVFRKKLERTGPCS